MDRISTSRLNCFHLNKSISSIDSGSSSDQKLAGWCLCNENLRRRGHFEDLFNSVSEFVSRVEESSVFPTNRVDRSRLRCGFLSNNSGSSSDHKLPGFTSGLFADRSWRWSHETRRQNPNQRNLNRNDSDCRFTSRRHWIDELDRVSNRVLFLPTPPSPQLPGFNVVLFFLSRNEQKIVPSNLNWTFSNLFFEWMSRDCWVATECSAGHAISRWVPMLSAFLSSFFFQ